MEYVHSGTSDFSFSEKDLKCMQEQSTITKNTSDEPKRAALLFKYGLKSQALNLFNQFSDAAKYKFLVAHLECTVQSGNALSEEDMRLFETKNKDGKYILTPWNQKFVQFLRDMPLLLLSGVIRGQYNSLHCNIPCFTYFNLLKSQGDNDRVVNLALSGMDTGLYLFYYAEERLKKVQESKQITTKDMEFFETKDQNSEYILSVNKRSEYVQFLKNNGHADRALKLVLSGFSSEGKVRLMLRHPVRTLEILTRKTDQMLIA